MLKLQKSSLILILIIVVLTAGCVSIYTLGYAPGTVWHKAEDVKSGTFGSNVGSGNYNFPDNIDVSKQVTAGTKFKVGVSEITSGKLTGLDAPTNSSDATNKAYVDAATGGVIAMSLTQYQYGMNDSCEWVRNGKYWLTQGGTVPPCLTSAPISCSVGRAVQCTRVTYSYYYDWGGESITCGTAGTWSSDLGPEGTPTGGSAYWPSGYRCWELE